MRVLAFLEQSTGAFSWIHKDTRFTFCSFVFEVPVYDILWKNIVEQIWPQMTVWLSHAHCMLDN